MENTAKDTAQKASTTSIKRTNTRKSRNSTMNITKAENTRSTVVTNTTIITKRVDTKRADIRKVDITRIIMGRRVPKRREVTITTIKDIKRHLDTMCIMTMDRSMERKEVKKDTRNGDLRRALEEAVEAEEVVAAVAERSMAITVATVILHTILSDHTKDPFNT